MVLFPHHNSDLNGHNELIAYGFLVTPFCAELVYEY